MRKELVSIILIFIVIFSLGSLLSYSPDDPSIHHAGHMGEIENFFGFFGAHLAGFLIGLFGLGAFLIPILFFIGFLEFYKNRSGQALSAMASGGIILTVSFGSLLSFFQETYVLFGNDYTAGGMLGLPIKSFLLKYSNWTGGMVILSFFLLIGFILSTGISVVATIRNFGKLSLVAGGRVKNTYSHVLEKRKNRKAELRAFKKKKINTQNGKSKNQDKKIALPFKKNKEAGAKKINEGREEKEILIKETLPPKPLRSVPVPKQQVFESMRFDTGTKLPSIDLLKDADVQINEVDHENLKFLSKLLEKKLDDFGVLGKVETVVPGPVITRFEFKPAPGIKITKVVNLTDDLALALRAISIRIIAPIPGRAVIGIEVPNLQREVVVFKDIVTSKVFNQSKSKLTLGMGKDIVGNPVVANLEDMPHLLIAGATGTGKSVGLNAMICSLLYKSMPEDVKMIMIDPKRIELSVYDGIPHLISPVVTDMKKATNALFWAVREMERRYKLLSESRVRNIRQYNRKVEKEAAEPRPDDEILKEKLPYIVIIIDELADLMMVGSRDVEVGLTRLAQMARASGIHLIIATQRPSVDVLTGIIKANFPTRLSFQVSSKTDSRTIIDSNGAEALLGNGDMLFLPPGTAKLQRIHGAYITEDELMKVIEFLKEQKPPEYDHEILEAPEKESVNGGNKEDYDERYDEAVALVTKSGQASISMIQRHLRIGYNRAARIVEIMEEEGVVGPSDGVKAREVLVKNYDGMD
ncbi:MAG: DNA translocase FtsK [Desulfobacteraceae bacterium]|nr:DNA translocase FtsK 4TM domain-containing protein [Desulfobacteraceae bacterium]MBC2757334.1 DNA translocase FtsK [Desulfobacteraceae bacterium]MBC2763952.1 DNA translocase FtsK [ANME-2 cluster archaeon]